MRGISGHVIYWKYTNEGSIKISHVFHIIGSSFYSFFAFAKGNVKATTTEGGVKGNPINTQAEIKEYIKHKAQWYCFEIFKTCTFVTVF